MGLPVSRMNPGDIVRDKNGNNWVVLWIQDRPSLCVESLHSDPKERLKMEGGVDGLMWEGFQLLVPEGNKLG